MAKSNELREYISSHHLIEILSQDTGSLYLDKEGNAFLFEKQEVAEGFIAEHENTVVGSPQSIDYDTYIWRAWCLGIKFLVLNGKKETAVTIHRGKNIREYANPELTRCISLLQETREPEYLKSLGDKKFIVPVVITTIETRGIKKPVITFSVLKVGKIPNADKQPVLYVSFTDLDHYDAWRASQSELYQPLEMEFWQYKQVFGDSGIVVNPGEDGALYLFPDLLSMIEAKMPEESYFKVVNPGKEPSKTGGNV